MDMYREWLTSSHGKVNNHKKKNKMKTIIFWQWFPADGMKLMKIYVSLIKNLYNNVTN